MRRFGDLWPRLVSFENLHAAAVEALRGKRSRVCAGRFFRDLEGNLLGLQRELRARGYRPGAYRTFWIQDPKPRRISAAPFRDRVVHHALVRVIEPLFERRFIHHSYACRCGKGTHRALAQFVRWARSARCVLMLDVRKFFPSIDHSVLKARIRYTVKDPDVLWLCDRIIDGSNAQEPIAGWFPGDDLFAPFTRRRGIPIGNLTSQFLANVYLDPLDHYVTDELRCGRYLRYVDDFCCFADDKGELRALRARVSDVLAGLRLRLNEGKSRVRQVSERITFLGFVVGGSDLRLAAGAVRRQRHRLRGLRRRYASGALELDVVAASLRAWHAHAAFGTTAGLRQAVARAATFTRSASAGRGVACVISDGE